MSNFTFTETKIKDLFVIETKTYGDERGYFMEVYKEHDFQLNGLHYHFIQDNQSKSQKGVLRGLHFQVKHPQAKLVRVISGEIFDVAVDLRKSSPTYGEWYGVYLSNSNNKQLLIPRGFAHGFLVLSDHAEVIYKCDNTYVKEDESGIIWNDCQIAINWPVVENIILSEKDKNLLHLSEIKDIIDF